MPFREGDIVAGEFHIEEQIGVGEVERVYRALGEGFQGWVAVKELSMIDSGMNPVQFAGQVRRMRTEFNVQRQLIHPNVAQVYQMVELERDRFCLVMEYASGGSLRELLSARGTLRLNEAISITRQMLAALQAAHQDPREIVHRAVRPSVVLLTRRGTVKLGGFGLAQIGEECLRSRTHHPHPGYLDYMPPEQASTQDYLSAAADVYSAGCVLFEMLCGASYRAAQCQGEGLRDWLPDAPAWLVDALIWALDPDPGRRCQRARDFENALTSSFNDDVQKKINEEARAREEEERALREELTKSLEQMIHNRPTNSLKERIGRAILKVSMRLFL